MTHTPRDIDSFTNEETDKAWYKVMTPLWESAPHLIPSNSELAMLLAMLARDITPKAKGFIYDICITFTYDRDPTQEEQARFEYYEIDNKELANLILAIPEELPAETREDILDLIKRNLTFCDSFSELR